MLKRMFSIIGAISLVCFSFYYTNIASVIIKNSDPIMKEIKRSSSHYESDYINASVFKNNIIPGINGVKVDIDKSYYAMKKYGEFNDNLLIFKEVTPFISVSNIYDKYISKGNNRYSNVALVFKIENTNYIEEILNVLCSKDISATFFLNKSTINNSEDILDLIIKNGSNIEFLDESYTSDLYKKYNKIIKKYSKKDLKYCYLENENLDVLNNCSNKKMYTILPNIITKNYPYNSIKVNIEKSSIISLTNNEETLRELKYIINYITQKGYDVVSLDELIKE